MLNGVRRGRPNSYCGVVAASRTMGNQTSTREGGEVRRIEPKLARCWNDNARSSSPSANSLLDKAVHSPGRGTRRLRRLTWIGVGGRACLTLGGASTPIIAKRDGKEGWWFNFTVDWQEFDFTEARFPLADAPRVCLGIVIRSRYFGNVFKIVSNKLFKRAPFCERSEATTIFHKSLS